MEAKNTNREDLIEVLKPKVGVYVCHCGLNIAKTVDCPKVAKMAEKLKRYPF